jgi:hypothetical protein
MRSNPAATCVVAFVPAHTCDVTYGGRGVHQDRAVLARPLGSRNNAQHLLTRHPGLATARCGASRGSFVLRCSQIGGWPHAQEGQLTVNLRLTKRLIAVPGLEPLTRKLHSTQIPAPGAGSANGSQEFCSQMFSSLVKRAKTKKSTDCKIRS